MQSNSDYVTSLYQIILGRKQDDVGLDLYTTLLDQGRLDRETLRRMFLESPEFVTAQGSDDHLRRPFNLAYGRQPTTIEIDAVEAVANRIGAVDERGFLRATLAAFGRVEYPTSVATRFEAADIVAVKVAQSDKLLMLDKADMSVSDNIIQTGRYEDHIGCIMALLVRPGMTVADVGANVGFHTLRLSELVGVNGSVYAFEPNTENARMLLLSKNHGDLRNVEIFPFALSDMTGCAFFSPAIGSNGGFMANEAATIVHPNCTIIPTLKMDDVINPKQLDFMKIDVEGAEYLVLKGAMGLVQKHRPAVVAELSLEMLSRVSQVSGADYIRFMQGFGYDIFTLGLSGPVVEVNNTDQFLSGWGNPLRIEDLAFIPKEREITMLDIQDALVSS